MSVAVLRPRSDVPSLMSESAFARCAVSRSLDVRQARKKLPGRVQRLTDIVRLSWRNSSCLGVTSRTDMGLSYVDSREISVACRRASRPAGSMRSRTKASSWA